MPFVAPQSKNINRDALDTIDTKSNTLLGAGFGHYQACFYLKMKQILS